MAYMSTAHAAQIRANLKAKFPEFKFAVRKSNYTAIHVSILSGPVEFFPAAGADDNFCEYTRTSRHADVNHYHINSSNFLNRDKLQEIFDVINEGNRDRSDIMTDYFDVGFYIHFYIGDYNKPYILKNSK